MNAEPLPSSPSAVMFAQPLDVALISNIPNRLSLQPGRPSPSVSLWLSESRAPDWKEMRTGPFALGWLLGIKSRFRIQGSLGCLSLRAEPEQGESQGQHLLALSGAGAALFDLCKWLWPSAALSQETLGPGRLCLRCAPTWL